MSQPTLPTRTSSFFASIQLEWVGSNLSVFTVWSPLISLLSLQIKYSGEACSAVRWPVNLQPAVTAFISCHENRSSKQTTLLQGRRQRGGKKQHHGQTVCITEHGFSSFASQTWVSKTHAHQPCSYSAPRVHSGAVSRTSYRQWSLLLEEMHP